MLFLKILCSKWKVFAKKIGIFQSRLILTIFYFSIFAPFGIIFSLLKDELRIRKRQKSTWIRKAKQCQTLEAMKEQY